MGKWARSDHPMKAGTGAEKVIKVAGNGTGKILEIDFDNGERVRIDSDLLYDWALGHLANFLRGEDGGRWRLEATWRKDLDHRPTTSSRTSGGTSTASTTRS